LEREPISLQSHATIEGNRAYFPDYFRFNYLGKGQAYICRLKSEKRQVVGVFTGHDETTALRHPPEDEKEASRWHACDTLVDWAHETYKKTMIEELREPWTPGVHFYLDLLGVSQGWTGRGIGLELTERLIGVAAAQGFTYAFVFASAAHSQKIFRRLGFEVIAEMQYSEFKVDESFPFAAIKDPPSALLLYLPLKTRKGSARVS